MTNPLFDQLFGSHTGKDTAFLHLPSGETLSHGAFLRLASRLAHAIVESGIKPGDRVAVQTAKSPEMLALYAACVQTGAVFLPLNPAYTAPEIAYFIEDSGARIFVCDTADKTTLQPVADASGAKLLTLNKDGTGSLMQLANTQSETFPTIARQKSDIAALLYTSGTTGRSKGAMLSQENLLSNAVTLAQYWQFTDSDVLLHALPIFHTHGLFVATNTMLICGGSMIFMPKFSVDKIIEHLPQATTMMGVPTFYTRLLNDPRFDKKLVKNMRLFISGSAPLLAETHKEFEARTDHKILERYGMTETNMNASNPYEGERKAGTVGLPLPGVEIQIVDDAGAPLPAGEIGNLQVRGPNVFHGYWQMPEKTAAELREDGFFITGDLGMIDGDGYLTIVGRDKDLIISGGFNIYPKEVEELLDAMPGVLESAVIAAPHPDLGEAPVAVIVAQPNAIIEPNELLAALSDRLARFKHPRHFHVIAALPRNTMGKVQKATLRDQFKTIFN